MRAVLVRGAACLVVLCGATVSFAQEMRELTAPVNDFANVIDAGAEAQLDALIRSLQQASGDVMVVATVPTIEPYGDVRQYAVEMFENRGRGIGQKGKDNGLLILLAVQERRVWVEVGYDLEGFITDGFAGETSRQYMVPEFRNGDYGAGLVAGATRLAGRIAAGRNVTLEGVPAVPARPTGGGGGALPIVPLLFLLFILFNAIAGRSRRGRRRGWHSGVGPFGGGFGGLGGFGGYRGGGFGGGGFGGGGFGGGFGGFGGGRSGGGGGGGSW